MSEVQQGENIFAIYATDLMELTDKFDKVLTDDKITNPGAKWMES